MRQRYVSGGILIALGLLFLMVNRMNVGAESVVAVVGTAFLVWFAYTRNYGLLIPGAILTGLGLGIILLGVIRPSGASVLIGLGSGFISIYVIDCLMGKQRSGGWWPLIPGSILLFIGLSIYADAAGWLRAVGRWWPLALVVAGLLILRDRSKSTQGPNATTPIE